METSEDRARRVAFDQEGMWNNGDGIVDQEALAELIMQEIDDAVEAAIAKKTKGKGKK